MGNISFIVIIEAIVKAITGFLLEATRELNIVVVKLISKGGQVKALLKKDFGANVGASNLTIQALLKAFDNGLQDKIITALKV